MDRRRGRRDPRLEREERARGRPYAQRARRQGELELQGLSGQRDAFKLRRSLTAATVLQDPSPDTASTSASNPRSRTVGDGGQPGIWSSKGSTADTTTAQAEL